MLRQWGVSDCLVEKKVHDVDYFDYWYQDFLVPTILWEDNLLIYVIIQVQVCIGRKISGVRLFIFLAGIKGI